MIASKVRTARISGLLVPLLLAGTALAQTSSTTVQMSSFQTALIPLEGGAKGFQGHNLSTNALGAFQLTPIALQDIGYKDASGNWTATAQAAGITSDNDFLNNPQAQVAADNIYNQKNVQYLGSAYNQYLGTTDPSSGATLTSGNLAYCAEALGAGGCRSYLSTGQVPANELAGNPSWANGGFQNNMNTMANTTLDGTGSVTVNSSTTQTGNGGSTSTTSVQGMFCDPAIVQAMTNSGKSMVDNWTVLAQRPETGYTLLGGQSVLQAVGLIGPGQAGYVNSQTGMFSGLAQSGQGTVFGGATFAMASCLNRLASSSLNILFNPPTLGDILAMLEQAACQEVTKLFTQLTAPLTQELYQSFSLNGIIPGMNLGSIGGGLGAAIVPGGAANGGGIVNINTGQGGTYSYNPDNGWYQSGSSSSSFGSSGSSGCNSPYQSMFSPNGSYSGFGAMSSQQGGSGCGLLAGAGLLGDQTGQTDPSGGGSGDQAGLAANYSQYLGQSVGSGQCVALLQAADPSVGLTATWQQGASVQGNTSLQPGTPIATFNSNGQYANATDGSSHAAIYLGQNAQGIQVLDQWSDHPAAVRTINWTNSSGIAADTGTRFSVINHG